MQHAHVGFDLCAEKAGWEDSGMRLSGERERCILTLTRTPPPQPRPPTWGEYQWNPCLAGGSGALPVAAGRKHVARRLLSRGQRTRQEVLQCYYNLKRKKKGRGEKKKPWWFLALNPNLHLIWESFA